MIQEEQLKNMVNEGAGGGGGGGEGEKRSSAMAQLLLLAPVTVVVWTNQTSPVVTAAKEDMRIKISSKS